MKESILTVNMLIVRTDTSHQGALTFFRYYLFNKNESFVILSY